MKSLTAADQLFLWLENRQQPMHVGGLHIFECPEDAGPEFVTDTARQLRKYTMPCGLFGQRLQFRLGSYFWDQDKKFDLSHHFQHEALPNPGSFEELLTLTSARHSNLLDRKRPLWECHLIEGMQNKNFAFYHKVHHSMIDGVAAMRKILRSYSFDARAREQPPIWAVPTDTEHINSLAAADFTNSLRQLAGEANKQLSTLPALIRAVGSNIIKSSKSANKFALSNAPPCILNVPITGSRCFTAQSFPLATFKNLAKSYHVTLNDIIVTVCSSALRAYLQSIGELPKTPLIAMVPMSVRTDTSDSGNQVATILANLGTHLQDPVKRLEAIKNSIAEAKIRFQQMTQEEAINYSALTLAPSSLPMLTGLAPQLQAFNVIISNVMGPDKPMYWNGARLKSLYPVSIPINRVALNITLTSYAEHMEFGLTACRRALPSLTHLLEAISHGIEELEAGVR